MERDISPPPTKRRKLTAIHLNQSSKAIESEPGDVMGAKVRCIRIFSWNINGIQSFLPQSSMPITSFFKANAQQQQKKRTRDDYSPDDFSPPHNASQEPSASSPLRAFLARHQWPEVIFLQELKISPTDQKTPRALLSAINTSSGPEDPTLPGTTYTLDVNRPRDKFNARGFGGKLYGVGTILRQDFSREHVGSVRQAGWDMEGRVCIVELRRQQPRHDDDDDDDDDDDNHTKPLALINVYAVNGTPAPYRSPETGRVAGTRHDHKLAFHSRLRDECLALERRGFGVVVAGDLNVARGRPDGCPGLRAWPAQHGVNRADFNGKFFGVEDNRRAGACVVGHLDGGAGGGTGNGGTGDGGTGEEEGEEGRRFDGVDVFRALHGRERKYTYHPRAGGNWGSSCDRVDLIIVSRGLYEAGRVVGTDILDTPQERGTSDHVPLWVAVKLVGNDGTGLD